MAIATKETSQCVTTYELQLSHSEIISLMAANGLDFLADPCGALSNPTLTVAVLDNDCGEVFVKKMIFSPGDVARFSFQAQSEASTTYPPEAVLCGENELNKYYGEVQAGGCTTVTAVGEVV